AGTKSSSARALRATQTHSEQKRKSCARRRSGTGIVAVVAILAAVVLVVATQRVSRLVQDEVYRLARIEDLERVPKHLMRRGAGLADDCHLANLAGERLRFAGHE